MNTFNYAIAILPLVALIVFSCGQTDKKRYETAGKIEIYDSRAKDVLAGDAVIEVLASGFDWAEGPVWVREHAMLLFSDVPQNRIWKWTKEGGLEKYLEPSGFTGTGDGGREPGSNGLLIDRQGSLVLCQHGDRRLARLTAPLDDPAPSFNTIADRFNGMRFNSPNDIVQHQNGDFYFTDPPYGFHKLDEDPAKEISFSGVYKVSADGTVQLFDSTLTRPNGIAFSPDFSFLYIAQSDPARAAWFRYVLNEKGELLSPGRMLREVTEEAQKEKGLPDGLKVHPNGLLFATGPGGVWVLAPDGQVLAKIRTGQATANCAFDTGYKHLYMTADSLLLRVALMSITGRGQ